MVDVVGLVAGNASVNVKGQLVFNEVRVRSHRCVEQEGDDEFVRVLR